MPLQKRFYKSVHLREVKIEGSSRYEVLLDDRPINTPKKRKLRIEQKYIASLVVNEWSSQGTYLDPSSMPFTKLLNSAIDIVQDNRNSILEDIVRYAASDLICYRAQSPEALVALQWETWEPLLKVCEEELGHLFERADGILYIEQPRSALRELNKILSSVPDVSLAALHLITTLTGSALLAFLLYKKKISAEKAWISAHIDEDWQNRSWGIDPEANMRRLAQERDYKAASILLGA